MKQPRTPQEDAQVQKENHPEPERTVNQAIRNLEV
jgi:hypothetical protein